jgi:hypothetical protein
MGWSASRPYRALPPGEGPTIPIVQEAGWAPEPVWTQRLEEKSLTFPGDQTSKSRSSSPQPDTVLTELPGSRKLLCWQINCNSAFFTLDYKSKHHLCTFRLPVRHVSQSKPSAVSQWSYELHVLTYNNSRMAEPIVITSEMEVHRKLAQTSFFYFLQSVIPTWLAVKLEGWEDEFLRWRYDP